MASRNLSETIPHAEEASVDSASPQPKRPRIKCEKCHKRKVKCSGGIPCANCTQSGSISECIYPTRDRQVKMSEKYVRGLLEENHRLRENRISRSLESGDEVDIISGAETSPVDDSKHGPGRNPLLEDRAWFVPNNVSDMPFLIGEAADTAFSTRVQQALSNQAHNHIPRTQFASDGSLHYFYGAECDWPGPIRARFLLNVALGTVCTSYHVIRKTVVSESLELAIHSYQACDNLSLSKLWALFAFGELYSARVKYPSGPFPGAQYFCQAMKILNIPSERPRMDVIELCLLLSLYSLTLNRRHSAYYFISSAMRTAVTMGLHVDVPASQLGDPAIREHRVRVWWTAYILDRMCAVKLTQPVSIADDAVETELPADRGLSDVDFEDPQILIANVKLAKHASEVITSVYRRRKQDTPFSLRVQKVVRDLWHWVEELPDHLKIDKTAVSGTSSRTVVRLHLSFNQCVILATRPMLLHVISRRRASWKDSVQQESSTVPETISALAEACVRCARHSHSLITASWVDGSFPTFGYFHIQHLFSACIVLALSSLLDLPESRSDGERYDAATQLIMQLEIAGNYAAQEYCQHLRVLNVTLSSARNQKSSGTSITAQLGPTAPEIGYDPSVFTADAALSEPFLQDVLTQVDLDFGLLDTYIHDEGLQSLYEQNGGWMT